MTTGVLASPSPSIILGTEQCYTCSYGVYSYWHLGFAGEFKTYAQLYSLSPDKLNQINSRFVGADFHQQNGFLETQLPKEIFNFDAFIKLQLSINQVGILQRLEFAQSLQNPTKANDFVQFNHVGLCKTSIF